MAAFPATARLLLGPSFRPDMLRGIVQVCAVADQGSFFRNILMHRHNAPRCREDAFVLDLVRAAADAVVTTGRNARLEQLTPRVNHAGLALWRNSLRGCPSPPFVVLTKGNMDLNLPFFDDAKASCGEVKAVVVTDARATFKFLSSGMPGLRVIGAEEPTIFSAIDAAARLRACGDSACISIEAGPSTSCSLFKSATCEVETIVLSVLHDPPPRGTTGGPAAFDARTIERCFTPACEGSGIRLCSDGRRWSFSVLTRKA